MCATFVSRMTVCGQRAIQCGGAECRKLFESTRRRKSKKKNRMVTIVIERHFTSRESSGIKNQLLKLQYVLRYVDLRIGLR